MFFSKDIVKKDPADELFYAIVSGNLTSVQDIVSKSTINLDSKNKDGLTALMIASKHGYKNIVEFLVNQKVDLNSEDNKNWSAYMYACNSCHTEIAIYLVDNGAKVDTRDSMGFSIVMGGNKF